MAQEIVGDWILRSYPNILVPPLYARIFCIKSFSSAMKKKGYIVFDMKDINFDVK